MDAAQTELFQLELANTQAEVRAAQRYAKREFLRKMQHSTKAHRTLRHLVSERLSHDLLSQMHQPEFELNPLEEEQEVARLDFAKWAADRIVAEDALEAAPLPAPPVASAVGGSPSDDQELSDLIALKQHVQAAQAADDGLPVADFVRAVGKIWTRCTPQELGRMFMQIDADSDGKVTWEELLTFLLQKNSGGQEEDNRYVSDVEYRPPAPSAMHAAPISHIVPIPDKDKYLTVGRDATLRLWQRGGLQPGRAMPLAEKGWVNGAVYAEAHRKLVLVTANSRLLLLDMEKSRQQKGWRLPVMATAVCLVEAPDVSKEWASVVLVADKSGVPTQRRQPWTSTPPPHVPLTRLTRAPLAPSGVSRPSPSMTARRSSTRRSRRGSSRRTSTATGCAPEPRHAQRTAPSRREPSRQSCALRAPCSVHTARACDRISCPSAGVPHPVPQGRGRHHVVLGGRHAAGAISRLPTPSRAFSHPLSPARRTARCRCTRSACTATSGCGTSSPRRRARRCTPSATRPRRRPPRRAASSGTSTGGRSRSPSRSTRSTATRRRCAACASTRPTCS